MTSAGLRLPTGRVIALGRLLLATLFLLAILVDPSQPSFAPVETYALLGAYVVLALGLAVVTWRNWWLDVMLAAPAHALDISLFTILVLATEGYTSPYFTFFVFLLLSAAIRWGWRETALTAGLVTILYVGAGLMVLEPAAAFELNRFIVRSGHLVILSAILIWFGINQRRGRSAAIAQSRFGTPSLQCPAQTVLPAAADASGARSAMLAWTDRGGAGGQYLVLEGDELSAERAEVPFQAPATAYPFLYDIARDRGLEGEPHRPLQVIKPSERIDRTLAGRFGLREGLAVPIRSETGEGMLFLERVRDLSIDHLDLGTQLAAAIAGHFERGVLIETLEESSQAAARLVVARDLHDSVVQFLAGTAIRLEALIRSGKASEEVEAEIKELKRLVLLEQRDLRHFIDALRSAAEIPALDLADDLAELADKLGKQWDIHCILSASLPETMVPMRMRIDSMQLVREAVANAVRHGEADSVEITVSSEGDHTLKLEVRDNGRGFPEPARGRRQKKQPWSLKERVEQAGGTIGLDSKPGDTRISIALPIKGAVR